ncbi:PDR/VanB family oxidoreductase [Rhodococcus marinonascens]|uniref:PDR/VanB family oxidoreductase n=1 Tax=Rhodococcus marinonascens TaxID=38311 RepID=UPI000934A2BA|nr:PDR/VanB family oxidoreductase [Rhodococcus marinonascens]
MVHETERLLVRRKDTESEGVVSLLLEHPQGRSLASWAPGAHIDVVLPSGKVRQYSLCGDPEDTTAYRIAVLDEADGRGGSREIHDVIREGDPLSIQGPRNHFALDAASHYVLIAGGIGITPILAMARQLATEGASWRLYYGGRSKPTMAFLDELSQLGGAVTIVPQDECGHIDLEVAMTDVPTGAAVYCCGPESLITAVRDTCVRLIGSEAMHFERFAASSAVDAAPVGDTGVDHPSEFEVELRQTGCTLTVPADRSLLEVVLEANPDILYSCEDGFCGSCETRVLDGVPEHQDSILSAAEKEKGETMLICVGRSRTERLVLDA